VMVFNKISTLIKGKNLNIMAFNAKKTKVIWAIAQALEKFLSYFIAKAIITFCIK